MKKQYYPQSLVHCLCKGLYFLLILSVHLGIINLTMSVILVMAVALKTNVTAYYSMYHFQEL